MRNKQTGSGTITDQSVFEDINENKANMDHIYDQPDPRDYFRELRKLGYSIPDEAKPVFEKLISLLKHPASDTVHVLDIGCSYGINAALLKHDLSMSKLYDHWGQQRMAAATPEEVVEYDRRFFSKLDLTRDIEVSGLDQAGNAIGFAEEIGLLDEGLSVNLEAEPLPSTAKEDLETVDLVISTGCIGYVTEKSFDRLLPTVTRGRSPWLANFVLRMFPFDGIKTTLENQGYVTEKLEGHTFIQRRFSSAEEQDQVVEQLREQGIDPTGKEADGHLLAEFYLSRPANLQAEAPIEQLGLA